MLPVASYKDLVAVVLDDTIACQSPKSPESQARRQSQYGPLGAHIPGRDGSYPTTDQAMEALAELADRVRGNDSSLRLAIGRDSMRLLASQVIGELLDQLIQEPDRTQHWPIIRSLLLPKARKLGQNMMHYVPVWLFLGQECQMFDIGSVRFSERKDWMDAIAHRRGQESPWMPSVRKLWSGGRLSGGSHVAGLAASLRALRREPTRPVRWMQAYTAGRRFSEPNPTANARTIARLVHPDQWIACAEVEGFDSVESRRRGLLAARVALDTIRLAVPGKHRHLIATAADSVLPLSVDRLSQMAGQDLAHGWRMNRPGLSGVPGLAQDIVGQAAALFTAAGACISAAVTTNPIHPCPELADRWL